MDPGGSAGGWAEGRARVAQRTWEGHDGGVTLLDALNAWMVMVVLKAILVIGAFVFGAVLGVGWSITKFAQAWQALDQDKGE